MRRLGARDPVTPELRAYVLRRDAACIVGLLVFRHELVFGDVGGCRTRDGRDVGILMRVVPSLFDELLTVAHVRDRKGGRLGRRPPSTARRLAAVCHGHHLLDPVVDRRDVRPIVDAYLERIEGPEITIDLRPGNAGGKTLDRSSERIVRVRGAVSSSASEEEGRDGTA